MNSIAESATMSTRSRSPTSANTTAKKPTSTPIIESAHHLIDGSLHLLQDTLSGAGAANRFYPTGLAASRLQGVTVPQSQYRVGSNTHPAVQQGKQSASPATSSFTSRERDYSGSTMSTRVASVNMKKMQPAAKSSPNSMHKSSRLMNSQANIKMSKKKKADHVGKVKVSLGDAAHNIWKHIMGTNTNASKNRKAEHSSRVPSKNKENGWREDRMGLGLPPSPFNESLVKGKESAASTLQIESQVKMSETRQVKSEEKNANSTNPGTIPTIPANTYFAGSLFNSSSNIPFYSLLFVFIICYTLKRLLSYRNRTHVSRKLGGLLGNKQFSVSQEALRDHIDMLAQRNKTRVRGDAAAAVVLRERGDGNGDAAGGYVDTNLHKEKNTEKLSDKSIKSSSDGSLNSTLMQAISDSLSLLKDEKEELIHQRRLLLHDRDCAYDEKETVASEKKLILQLLSEKVEECQKALKANQKLKEAMKLMEAECAEANDTAQNLADKLAHTKKEKDRLKESLEKKRQMYADAVASISELKESLKESEGKIEKLTNENIILNNVIDKLEQENNEMEKVIDEACRSDGREVGIDEIDVAYITSYSGVSEAESLTKDDDDDDDALEEVARLQEEKKSLENKVVELQQSLNQTQTKLESVICKNELSATAPQSRVDHSSELKIVELGNLLEQKQSELDKLSTANLEISLKFSSLQTEYDTLNKPSSLQQARISNLESKVEELQKLLTRTQLDLDKKINDIAEAKATIIRVQSERDSLQQQLIQAEESMHQTSLDSADKITTPALESMKVKNNQLQNSLADLESLYKSLCVEKSNMEKSIEITSNRFKDLLSEKETLQSSLKRERKRINWCNQILQDASQSAFTLIAELQTELKRANCTTAVVSDSSQSPMSALSDCSSESKTLMHHAEVLQKQLVELKQTNQHLMLVLHTLLPNAADGVVEAIEELTALSTSNEHAANQTFATAGSDSSGDMNVIQQMIENAKNSRNAKVDGEMKRLVRSLENETKANPMPKRDKSTSPTNSSPTLSRALSMKRLWRKKSGP
jgi:hypothetical protein